MEDKKSRKSNVKRLTDNVSSHIPQMSNNALKRWQEARDTYLGDQYSNIKKHRKIKPKYKSSKPIQSRINLPIQQFPIILEQVDDKCVGTEINEAILFETDIEQIDESIQADLPTPENENKQQIQFDQESIEYNDQSTETDLILNIKQDDEVDIKESTTDVQNESKPIKDDELDIQSIKEPTTNVQNDSEPIKESIKNVQNESEPINDDDTKTILSSNESNISISEQFIRLRQRFKRVSRERRLITCLLALYLFIMCALLVVIFILLWAYQERPLVLTREVKSIDTNPIDGVARYGESCKNDNDCKRPFICYKRNASSGSCRCPLNYNIANNQCVGDLNALCKKDTDCQRYMLCSGMNDGKRRCHCQTLYNYDTDRKQCRGDYQASCQSNNDCRANLICNKTTIPSVCLCQVNYQYYPLGQKCRGDPGAICEQTTAECTDNAECRDGACECAFQFIANAKKICVDPCPKVALKNRVKIRYPGNCRRFIDCQHRTKNECPEPTIFNFRTQLCDYRKNVLDCR